MPAIAVFPARSYSVAGSSSRAANAALAVAKRLNREEKITPTAGGGAVGVICDD
jgi:hypothetical protein